MTFDFGRGGCLSKILNMQLIKQETVTKPGLIKH